MGSKSPLSSAEVSFEQAEKQFNCPSAASFKLQLVRDVTEGSLWKRPFDLGVIFLFLLLDKQKKKALWQQKRFFRFNAF